VADEPQHKTGAYVLPVSSRQHVVRTAMVLLAAMRATIYFPARSLVSPVAILMAWATLGVAAMVIVGHGRRGSSGGELEFEAGMAMI
jgi:hypothetical protein